MKKPAHLFSAILLAASLHADPLPTVTSNPGEDINSAGLRTWEGGVRVPAIFSWPGHLPTGAINRATLSSLDIVPLAVALAGGKLPADRVFDGRDPFPALQGKATSPHRALHWM